MEASSSVLFQRMCGLLLACTGLGFTPATIAADSPGADSTMVGPVYWSMLSAPIIPVLATDGRIHLAWEINVSNEARAPARITSIEVLDAATGRVTGASHIDSSDGKDITGKVRPFALEKQTQAAADFTDQLGPGGGGVVYFSLTYASRGEVPHRIRHRIVTTIEMPGQPGQAYTVEDAGVEVSEKAAIVIAPPLKGDGWLVANGAGPIISPHRYTTQPTNGRLRPPEHFAIDFIRLDKSLHAFTGDGSTVGSWFGYDNDVVSVAPGKVVEAVDDMQDVVPGQPRSGLTADQYPGNYVLVDIGEGRFAAYAHLAPGSVAVRKGEVVRTGQRLGKLGSTGNSDAPHLHFQISDSASFLNTNGLPFVFDTMEFHGRFSGTLDDIGDVLAAGKPAPIDAKDTGPRVKQMPLTLDLVGFPGN